MDDQADWFLTTRPQRRSITRISLLRRKGSGSHQPEIRDLPLLAQGGHASTWNRSTGEESEFAQGETRWRGMTISDVAELTAFRRLLREADARHKSCRSIEPHYDLLRRLRWTNIIPGRWRSRPAEYF